MSKRRQSYTVTWQRAGDWRLDGNRSPISHHPTASAAIAAARHHSERRRRNVAILRNTVVALLVVVLWAAALPHAEVTNPRYASPRALTDDMNTAYREIEASRSDVLDFTTAAHGFAGGSFEVSLDFGGLGSAVESSAGPRTYLVLVGMAEGRCHLMRWQSGGWPLLGILSDRLPCLPSRAVASHSSIVDIAVNLPDTRLDWGPVLPSPTMVAGWFVPLTTLLALAFLLAFVDTTIVLIRGAAARKRRRIGNRSAATITVLGPDSIGDGNRPPSLPTADSRR